MNRITRTLVAVLAMVFVLQPVLSVAGSGARIIPQGKVSLLEEGREASQFQSEMPLPEGMLMLCNGSCVVQTPNLQLVARDQAVFALAEGKGRWDLTVKTGQIDFALRPDAKPISFHTPHDTLQTDGAIVSASGASMVRGSLVVTENESLLTMHEGTLQVMSADGTVLVEPGQGMRLAQAPMKAATAGKPAATATGGGYHAAWTYTALVLGFAAIITPPVVLETTKNESKPLSPK